jgi:trk system potassium uptake protein TrkH
MNYRIIARLLGIFSIAIGVLMLPSALWAIYFGEFMALAAFAEAAAAAVIVGGLLYFIGRSAPEQFYQREALGLVGLSWLLIAGIGALPYVFGGVLHPIDAYFESMSGFTTTGSSVFTPPMFESTPASIMFWRSFTHWLGGMGIIVLFIAVLPYLGAGGKQMFRSESPGPNPRGLSPRIRDTASALYKIYLGLTLVQTIALMLAGMSFYDALCHTFGTLATGGFSTRAASIEAYDSVPVDLIVIFFMICAGTNFGLYFSMLRGNLTAPFRDTEWRVYILVLAGATLLVTCNVLGVEGRPAIEAIETGGGKPIYESPFEALRYSAFQVVSITTTTGYATADFDAWPTMSRVVLVALMFVGGCAGSTGGGLKIVRVILLVKMAYWRLESTFRPKTVRAIRIGDHVLDTHSQHLVNAYLVLLLGWFLAGSLFMAALGLPLQTAVTSVAATLNNIGPGLELIGPTMNFSQIPYVGKVFLSLCMVLGRLELFSITVLLVPAFWLRR